MKINVHAGHNPDGKVACGAVGVIKESTEARSVVYYLIQQLKAAGHIVYDCTVNDGISQGDVLKKIVSKCNSNDVDLDISIHFNAGVNDYTGNGVTTGTECYVYRDGSVAYEYGKKICENIALLGYRNRGIKTSKDLYFLNHTKAQAILVECCFVDDRDDVNIYSAQKMAAAIANAIGVENTVQKEALVENSVMIVNGSEVVVRRILQNGTNYIAIRDIAEALGYTVGNKDSIPILDKKQ